MDQSFIATDKNSPPNGIVGSEKIHNWIWKFSIVRSLCLSNHVELTIEGVCGVELIWRTGDIIKFCVHTISQCSMLIFV